VTTAVEAGIRRPRSADLAATGKRAFAWRRVGKFTFGAALLAAGLLTIYQQLVVRVSRDAVINARVAVIRAPIDGIATTTVTTPGTEIKAGTPIGRVEDPLADDARLAQLEREASAAELERDSLARRCRLSDLERARAEAEAQAEAYRIGRVRQLELRIEEARANLAAATEREGDANATAARGAALQTRGFQSDEAQEKARHAQEIERQGVVATGKRIDALTVELDAARNGTFLGDSYNDVPSSLQRARELALRVAETQTAMDDQARKSEAMLAQLAAERQRLAAHAKATLTAPVEGQLWTVQAAPGEYVRKGQDILTVLDCSTVVVTASVTERDYNELRLGDRVRFRVSGTDRDYAGRIVKLGSTTTFAIPPAQGRQQIVVSLLDLPTGSEDGCAVGRTGEITFDDTGRSLTARLTRSLRSLLNIS
jgi:multidrug resistance efflux pump